MRKLISVSILSAAALSLAACDVEQTEEGEMPDMQVDVDGGNLPEFDVDTADVSVGTEEQTIEVPTLDIEPADASQPEAAE